MKPILMILGAIALLLTIVPPVLFMNGGLPGDDAAREVMMKNLIMAGTLLWFVTAPLWMKKED
ncbi:hypothetical protein [Luteolibacter marinus]|uniref:hypothetical protein n=1 Tax=Luteolibacter marinus TaxID=2776705 RepID=UPI0018694566|nr:hypothetical protein [Luteolibacter marinus]